MTKAQKQAFSLFFFLIFILAIVPSSSIVPVMASEEEEVDGFDIMPTYRWEDVETTSGTQESLSDDNYEVYTYSNDSSISKYEQERGLNTRDFEAEARFLTESGGNQTEYFRDVLGDAADFSEDVEGFVQKGSVPIVAENGLLKATVNSQYEGIRLDVGSGKVLYPVYHTVRFRAKADSQITFRMIIQGDPEDDADDYPVITTEWQIFELLVNNDVYVFENIPQNAYPGIRFETGGGYSTFNNIYFDYFQLIGDLDYATHVEGEIEDTWDWEDSIEYFYDEEHNISDFNDGTTEDWTSYGADNVTSEDGWLNATKAASLQYGITRTLSVDAGVYDWLTFEFWSTSNVTSISMWDSAFNNLGTVSTGWIHTSKHLFSAQLDADWTGTETELYILFILPAVVNSSIYFNFTFLYDVELGDLEGIIAVLQRAYVNPNGYLTGTCTSAAGYDIISWMSLDIETSIFSHIKIKIRTFSDHVYFIFKAADAETSYQVSPNTILTQGEWFEDTIDVSAYSDWEGDINKLEIAILRLGGDNFDGNELIEIDYLLVLGSWAPSQFKFSITDADSLPLSELSFAYHNSSMYNISFDLFDFTNTSAFSFTEQFPYTGTDWLRLDFKMNMEKKRTEIKIEYDNGIEIFDYDLYEMFTIGRAMPKIFTTLDYPSICLNNSQVSMARSLVIIDFINAPWNTLDWTQPDYAWTTGYDLYVTTFDQEPDTFLTHSPYGAYDESTSITTDTTWYQLDIDRFDGLSFSLELDQDDWEDYDQMRYGLAFYNVDPDGVLHKAFDFHFILAFYGADASQHFVFNTWHYNGSHDREMRFATSAPPPATSDYDVSFSFSIYADYNLNKIILQMQSDNVHVQELEQSTNWDEPLTREMVFREGYRIWDSDGSDIDIHRFRVSQFDVVRKDIFSAIAGAILDPIIGFIQWLFTPLTLTLLFLAAIFKQIGPTIFGLFEGFLDSIFGILGEIGSALGSLAAGIWALFETAFGDVLTELGSMAAGIWAQFSTVLGDILTDLASVGDFVITALLVELANMAEDLIEALLTLGTLLAELQQMLIQFVIDTVILTFLNDIFTMLGLGWLFDWIIEVLTDVGTLILSITELFIHWLGFMIQLLLFLVENIEPLLLIFGGLWIGWLLIPLLFFFTTPFEDWFGGKTIGIFEEFGMRIKDSVILLYDISKGMIEFIIRIVTTIGNFIPFT